MGRTHLHTDFSLDAATFGVKLSPDDAYRFALGEEVNASNGVQAKLAAPLDFLMVSDHSDDLGSMQELKAGNRDLLANPVLQDWLRLMGLPDRKDRLGVEGKQTEQNNPPELDNDDMRASYWSRTVAAAEKFNHPGKFGLIGSTDSHTGLSTADDDNFFGKHSAEMEPSATRWKDAIGGRGETIVPGWMMASSGYAAVWVRDNTRQEIWDAFRRREVYATTGPRMAVRFFGGWNYKPADAKSADLAGIGYASGVPMGGELSRQGSGKAPRFLIQAMKDPRGATLDRVQIVKGWIDAKSQTHEKVFDVVWGSLSGARRRSGFA